jgi:hypothetical protein
MPKKVKAAENQGITAFPLLSQLRIKAKQLGITADAALELVLSYERSKRQE